MPKTWSVLKRALLLLLPPPLLRLPARSAAEGLLGDRKASDRLLLAPEAVLLGHDLSTKPCHRPLKPPSGLHQWYLPPQQPQTYCKVSH